METALSAPDENAMDLASFARGLFAPLGGIELELPAREPAREPPTFGIGQEIARQPTASPEPAPKPVTASRRVKQPAEKKAAGAPANRRGRRA